MNSKIPNNWTLDKNNCQIQIVVWSSWIGKQIMWWSRAASSVFTTALLMAFFMQLCQPTTAQSIKPEFGYYDSLI